MGGVVVDKLADVLDPEKLQTQLLDNVMGFTLVTDTFVGLTQIQGNFKTQEAQTKILIKVVKVLQKALKKMQLDKMTDKQLEVRKLVCYIFCFIQEIFRLHRKNIDGKGVKTMQELLSAVGFPRSASRMFELWAEAQPATIAPTAEAPAQVEKMDDKKKGNEKESKSKKDDKKDEK